MKAVVLLIDQERFWQDLIMSQLQAAGYVVQLPTSSTVSWQDKLYGECDAILIGFRAIRHVEKELIKQVTTRASFDVPIVVSSTTWPVLPTTQRALYRLGVTRITGRFGLGRSWAQLIDNELREQREKIKSLSSYERFRLQQTSSHITAGLHVSV
jgi:hypothetical protein